jgi:GH24 family phage-related lysozyme (muramidase)
MARFQSFRGTEKLPTTRRPQVIADTAVGRATAGAGRQIQQSAAQVGNLAAKAQDRQNKIAFMQGKKEAIQFRSELDGYFLDASHNMEPGGVGFSESVYAEIDQRAKKFLESQPESVRAQADLEITQIRKSYRSKANRLELEAGYIHSRGILSDLEGDLLKTVRSNPATYDSALREYTQANANSALTPVERDEKARVFKSNLSMAWVNAQPASVRAQWLGPSKVDATSLIRSREGLETKSYPDKGGHDGKQFSGWRVGYGSDTVTKADGTVVRVTKDTVITRADAERDLERRISEFQAIAVKGIGVEAWQRMPPRAQAALTSITYNYGELPERLHKAVQSGDLELLATSIEGLKNDNGGVNAERRQQEADIIRGRASIPNASPEVQKRLDNLSYEDQVKLSDQAQRDLVSIASDRQETFKLDIATDPLAVDRNRVLDDPLLDDGQKASLINSLDSALKEGEKDRQAVGWANTQGKGNPLDPDDRKSAERVFDQAVAAEQNPDTVGQAIAASKGVVAKPYGDMIRNGLRSNDALQVGAAYERVAALYDIDPQAVRGAENGQELEDAVTKWRFFTDSMGLDAQQAAERLAELNSPEAIKNREALLNSAPVQKRLKEIDADHVEGKFAVWGPFNDPELGASEEGRAVAVSEYKALLKDTLGEVGGNLDTAEHLAFSRLTQDWGVSEYSPHGSKTVLKYPAEMLYPPVGESGHDYIREQVKDVLEEEDIDAKKFYLIGNEYTVADKRAQRAPRLTVLYVDHDGVVQQLPFAFSADVAAAFADEEARKVAELDALEAEHMENREDFEDRYPHGLSETDERFDFERQRSMDNYLEGPK